MEAWPYNRGMEKLPPGAQLAALRKRTPSKCEYCGNEFQALSGQRFCGEKCRVRAWQIKTGYKSQRKRRPPPAGEGT